MLRLVLEAAELGTWRWEVGGPEKPLIWDTRCKALFGLPPEAAVTYETWANGVHPEDRLEAESTSDARLIPPILTIAWFANTGSARSRARALASGEGPRLLRARSHSSSGETSPRVLGTVGDVTETELSDLRRIEREKRGRYFLALEEKLRSACTARDAVSAACETLGRKCVRPSPGSGSCRPMAWTPSWRARGALPAIRPLSSAGTGSWARNGSRTSWLAAPSQSMTCSTDPRFAADERAQAAYRAFGTRSSINVPLVRDGRPRAFLFVANEAPRAWTEDEIALAQETLERAGSRSKERAQKTNSD